MILIPIFILLLFVKRKRLKINYWKLLIYFSIPNIPFFIVSVRERFEPIAKTVIWVPYRIAGFFGVISQNNADKNVLLANIRSLFLMFGEHFYERRSTAALIIGLIFVILTVKLSIEELKKKKLGRLSVFLITFWLYYLALFVHGSPPFHYYAPILLIFPILIGLFFEKYLYNEKQKTVILSLFVFILIFINGNYFFSGKWFKEKFERTSNSVTYDIQKSISKSIINDAKDEIYSIKRVGAFDYYEGYFAQNYQYLLWWMGNEPKENSDILSQDKRKPRVTPVDEATANSPRNSAYKASQRTTGHARGYLYTIYEDIGRYKASDDEKVVFDKYDVIVTKEEL